MDIEEVDKNLKASRTIAKQSITQNNRTNAREWYNSQIYLYKLKDVYFSPFIL